MESPLAELDAWWENAYDDGAAGTTLLDFRNKIEVRENEWVETILIEFETQDDGDSNARWRLDIDDCWDYSWRSDRGEPTWHPDHVLLTRGQRLAWISFSEPFKDPLRSLGAAVRVHHEIAGNWIPLDRHLRPFMFERRFGELAKGPERLVSAYAKALGEIGDDVNLVVAEMSYREPGEPDREASVLTWGSSYFIAGSFKLSRQS